MSHWVSVSRSVSGGSSGFVIGGYWQAGKCLSARSETSPEVHELILKFFTACSTAKHVRLTGIPQSCAQLWITFSSELSPM